MMRRTSFVRGILLVVLLVGASLSTFVPSASAATPTLTVRPTGNLVAGSTVGVHLRGLPSDAAVEFVECDELNLPVDTDYPYCPDLATGMVNGSGRLDVRLTLADPVFLTQPFGDPTPLYCRNDLCNLYVAWADSSGATQSLSVRLWFYGSEATITATPSTDLVARQPVVAKGAYGARGHRLVVVEQACFQIIEASGCYGTRTLGETRISSNPQWRQLVHPRRYLADGTDCTDPDILGSCQLTAHVLDASGQPDDPSVSPASEIPASQSRSRHPSPKRCAGSPASYRVAPRETTNTHPYHGTDRQRG